MKISLFVFFFTLSMDLMAQTKKPAPKPPQKVYIVYDCSAMKKQYDSMRLQLKLANFRLNRIRAFDAICDKHAGDAKFLKGWVKRALQ